MLFDLLHIDIKKLAQRKPDHPIDHPRMLPQLLNLTVCRSILRSYLGRLKMFATLGYVSLVDG